MGTEPSFTTLEPPSSLGRRLALQRTRAGAAGHPTDSPSPLGVPASPPRRAEAAGTPPPLFGGASPAPRGGPAVGPLATPPPAKARGPSVYHVSAAFGPEDGTDAVYRGSGAADAVGSLFDGINATICAYGQTGTGKTHTIDGIVACAFRDLFRTIEAAGEGFQHVVTCSILEVYNEQVFDLLSEARAPLRVLEGGGGGAAAGPRGARVVVEGLQALQAETADELQAFVDYARQRRAQAATQINDHSSRSHVLFRVSLETCDLDRLADGAGAGASGMKTAVLNIVDLAGAERASESGAQGQQLKEAGSINQSLLSLGNVVARLADPHFKGHVPYRASKLTRLLQTSLGGNARCLMICTISPLGGWHLEQTRGTLNFALRALEVRQAPVRNYVPPATVRQSADLIREVAQLRRRLADYQGQEDNLAGPRMTSQYKRKLGELTRALLDAVHSADPAQATPFRDLTNASPKSDGEVTAAKKGPPAKRLSLSPSKLGRQLSDTSVRNIVAAMAHARREKDDLRAKLQASLKEVEKLKGADGHLDALYRNFEDLVQLQAEECVMYEQRISDVEQCCREAEIDKERYLGELTEQQAEIQDLARAQAEDLQALASMRASAERTARLLAQEEFVKQDKLLAEAEEQIRHLCAQLKQMQQSSESKDDLLKRQGRLVEEMKSEVVTIPKLRKDNAALRKKLEDALAQQAESRRLFQALKADQAKFEAEQISLELELEDLKGLNACLAEENRGLDGLLTGCRQDVADLEGQLCAKQDLCKEQLALLDEQLAVLEHSTQASKDAAGLKEALAAANGRVAALEDLWAAQAADPDPAAPPAGPGAGDDSPPADVLSAFRRLQARVCQQQALLEELSHKDLGALHDGGEVTSARSSPGSDSSASSQSANGYLLKHVLPNLIQAVKEQLAAVEPALKRLVADRDEALDSADGQSVLLGQIAEQNHQKLKAMEEHERRLEGELATSRTRIDTLKVELEEHILALAEQQERNRAFDAGALRRARETADLLQRQVAELTKELLLSGMIVKKIGRNSRTYTRFIRLTADERHLEWFHISGGGKRMTMKEGYAIERTGAFYHIKGWDRNLQLIVKEPKERFFANALQAHIRSMDGAESRQASRQSILQSASTLMEAAQPDAFRDFARVASGSTAPGDYSTPLGSDGGLDGFHGFEGFGRASPAPAEVVAEVTAASFESHELPDSPRMVPISLDE